MRTPPPIHLSTIESALHDAFDMDLPVLTFTRGGEDAWGFKVASTNGAFHLKIYPRSDNTLVERLTACHALRTEQGIDGVISAVLTRDGLAAFQIDQFSAALFPYLLAATIRPTEWTDTQAEAVGSLLARVHAAQLDLPLPTEPFATGHADRAQAVVDALPSALESQNPVHHATARLMLPHETALRREIERLRSASQRMRQASIPFVICHGDPTWGNILFGPDPHLIDWDSMGMAPKERDLMFFADTDNPVLDAYRRAGGDPHLNADALMYYHAMWNNQEIADFGGRLLFESHTATQCEHDLAQLENFLMYSGLSGHAT